MKKFSTLFLIGFLTACNSTKTTIETPIVETKKVEVKKIERIIKPINAKKDQDGYLVGVADREFFQDYDYKEWFNSRYSEYTTDKPTIDQLKIALKGYFIKGFMGTWCEDSRRETPRFYKILDETGFDMNNLELITVDRTKGTPDGLQIGFDIIRVPTFIFYKDDVEIGRYVEYPREKIEKDILKIVTGMPYKHSYDKNK